MSTPTSLLLWQDELLACVLGVDVAGTRASAQLVGAGPYIAVGSYLHAGAISSPTALTDAGSQLLDTLLCAVLGQPAAIRGGLSPLGYLLASYGRLLAMEQVRGLSGGRFLGRWHS